MGKKLYFDLDELTACKNLIVGEDGEGGYKKTLSDIQADLAKAIETLTTEKSGWDSNASKKFVEKYNASWTQGINDRTAVITRMGEKLSEVIAAYETVEEELNSLKMGDS